MNEFNWFSDQETKQAQDAIKDVTEGHAKHIAVPGVCGVTTYIPDTLEDKASEIIFENFKTGEKFIV